MNFLIDTHTFIWFIENSPSLSSAARATIANGTHDIYLSIASLWEMSIKASLHRLRLGPAATGVTFEAAVRQQLSLTGVKLLPISADHALRVSALPYFQGHGDPFDRLLVAQSLTEGMPIISRDTKFDAYGVTRIWLPRRGQPSPCVRGARSATVPTSNGETSLNSVTSTRPLSVILSSGMTGSARNAIAM